MTGQDSGGIAARHAGLFAEIADDANSVATVLQDALGALAPVPSPLTVAMAARMLQLLAARQQHIVHGTDPEMIRTVFGALDAALSVAGLFNGQIDVVEADVPSPGSAAPDGAVLPAGPEVFDMDAWDKETGT